MNFLFLYWLYSNYIVPAFALYPVFWGIKNYRQLPDDFKILLIFIILSSVFNAINLMAIALYHYPTVKWLPFYTILEFTSIALVFSRIFNKKWRSAIYILILCFAVACTANSIFVQNKIEFNTYARPIGALIIVGFCMTYIIKTGTIESKWSDNNFNWINTGLLLYYSAGLVMFTFSNYFLKPSTLTLIIWTIHDTILTVEYVLFGIGFYKIGTAAKTLLKK